MRTLLKEPIAIYPKHKAYENLNVASDVALETMVVVLTRNCAQLASYFGRSKGPKFSR